MGHRDRERKEEGQGARAARGGRGDLRQQLDIVGNLVEEIRTIDSEIDLLKQKMNAVIRQINILKNAILLEKKEIKELEAGQELDKNRFEGMLRIIKEMKGE